MSRLIVTAGIATAQSSRYRVRRRRGQQSAGSIAALFVASNDNAVSAGASTTYSYDGMSRLSSLVQNASGTTNDTTKTYAYDADDRMIASGTATESYDPAGRLYQTVAGGVTERFLYAGAQIIAEYNGSNALQRRFVPGGLDEPLVWLEGTGTTNRKWLLADERGSIVFGGAT